RVSTNKNGQLNQDITIRTDCCYGLVLSSIPTPTNGSTDIVTAVKHFQAKKIPFQITDSETKKFLNQNGIKL
ncbi:MAG: hypothetical protein ACOZAJ_01140, partial [Patescibacteria group bacterium]